MKPTLLLHICCAPDEAWVVHTLRDQFQLHCFFCNPNISPEEEYEHRCTEAVKVATHYAVPFTADAYAPNTWRDAVLPYRQTAEGGERCRHCFSLRLMRSAEACATLGLKAFTTVMSISPHKKTEMLNEEGERAAREFGVVYHPYNFKKNDGFKKSIELSNQLGLYRQDYCGCELSRRERNERILQRQKPLQPL